MAYEWEHPDFGSSPICYTLEYHGPGRIGLDDSNGHQQVLGLEGRAHEVYRVGSWMVESRRSGEDTEVRFLWLDGARRNLQITFEQGTVDVTLTAQLAQPKRRKLQKITMVELCPGKPVQVTGQEPEKKTTVGKKQTPPAASPTPPGPTAAQAEAIQTALAKARQELQDCRGELSREKERRLRLEETVSARLEDLANLLQTQTDALNDQLRDQLERLRELETKRAQAAADVAAGQRRLESLQAELEGLQADLENGAKLEEVRSVDIRDTQGKVEALRRQWEEDDVTLQLMQEEPFLNGATLAKTMEQARKALETVENRIGWIIRVREKINGTVQEAILSGNGTIPLRDERGGDDRGDGAEPETADP